MLWIKAFHICAVIFWMAGLLYLPRLYVYHHQTEPGSEMDTALKGQERRLLKIIMTPALLASLILGLILIGNRAAELTTSFWLPIKLVAVFALIFIHAILAADRKKFERGERPRTEKFYRILNEVPALLTIVIVIMAIVEPF